MRLLVIVARALPFVVSFRRDRRRWLLFGAPLRRTPEFHRRRADALVRAIADLGPAFVKLAQVFAGRVDLLPEPYVSALTRLTDRVPAVPLAAVEAEIRASYGLPAAELFESFDPVPVAAASLGQVHRARWQGQTVAVKVLRPGVERLVAKDIAAAQRILDVVMRHFDNAHLRGLRNVVGEFATRIHEEMDFRLEAANAEAIRANFAGNPRVRVPRVLPDLVRQRVLVMEFMEGAKLDELDAAGLGHVLRSGELVRSVMEVYLQMMMIDGFFHADPHPGNLLVAPDGTLVLLDFGMVVRVPRELRWTLVQTVFAAIRGDPEGTVAGFYALGIVDPAAEREQILSLVRLLLGLAKQRTTTQERIQLLLAEQVMQTLYDWPVVLPSNLVYFARTAALIEGLGIRHDAHFNAIAFASPIALRMRGRILASLRGDAEPSRADWASAVGGVLGRVAGIVHRAGREIAAVVAEQWVMAGR